MKKNIFLGLIFIITGFIFLAFNTNLISADYIFGSFWPLLFIIIPGLIIHLAYFSRIVPSGMLVPGGIVLFTGGVLQVSSLFQMWGVMWPGYIMSVAVGLFELYIFGPRKKGLLIPVFILGAISLIFFYFTFDSLIDFRYRNYLISGVLIVSGLIFIFRDGFKGEKT